MLSRRLLLGVGVVLPLANGAPAGQTEMGAGKKDSFKRVLLIGVDPSVVDYTSLPDLNAQKLSAILDSQKNTLAGFGCNAEWCFIDQSSLAQHKVADVLMTGTFDVVSIGAGVRLPPDNLLLFERVLNAVHHHAPQAKICFSKTAKDTVEGVQRWL